jgi:hypothetical protein
VAIAHRYVRHVHTEYDDLLASGYDAESARHSCWIRSRRSGELGRTRQGGLMRSKLKRASRFDIPHLAPTSLAAPHPTPHPIERWGGDGEMSSPPHRSSPHLWRWGAFSPWRLRPPR